jgi:hypothetical protein
MIARDLYRLQQEVDRLETRLRSCPPEMRDDLEEELRKAKAGRERVKRMLDGSKDETPYRKAK